jgi:hypothetical protein
MRLHYTDRCPFWICRKGEQINCQNIVAKIIVFPPAGAQAAGASAVFPTQEFADVFSTN